MSTLKFEVAHPSVVHLFSPAVALMLLAVAADPLDLPTGGSGSLSAASSILLDEDGDGVVYSQERILETSPSAPDSDLDGYSDAEELARKTSPINALVQPQGNSVGAGITARGDRDGLHALVAVYAPDGDFSGLDISVGVVAGRRLHPLRTSYLLTSSQVDFVSGSGSNSQVALLDINFPRSWVDEFGHLTMYTVVSRGNSGAKLAAAAMDLFNVDGVIVLSMPDPSFVPTAGMSGPPQGPRTLYKPLTLGNGDPPAGWTMGEVCVQSSQPVMVGGAVVVHEVSSAACQGGWEGACPPDCSASVGTTYTTVDPVVLVGG